MNERKRMIFASFAVTLILILFCAGFIAVDLSADRYMPGEFGSFFEITSLSKDKVDLTVFSQKLSLSFSKLQINKEFLTRLRALLPAELFAGAKAVFLTSDYLKKDEDPYEANLAKAADLR